MLAPESAFADVPPAYEARSPIAALLAGAFVLLGLAYLGWRAGTLSPQVRGFAWAVYVAEVYGYLSACLHLFMCWRLRLRRPPSPLQGLSVDVFVTTYNEPVDLVRRTLLCARAMAGTHQTWLLDDGHRAEMQALAERLGVRYLARTVNTDAKAGNLNHGLAHSTADFVAIFDADHAPHKHFLTRTLGYFRDPAVAFVQTPQEFFNLDSFQHRLQVGRRRLWTEQSLFFRVVQRGKDYWNAAFFCGSCAVVRRRALDGIGGFATGTVTEDLHTSVRLHKAGWQSVFHAEPLAFGVAPAQVGPFLRQRVRWGQGAMQVLRQEGIVFSPGLGLAQRLNYLASILTYFDGWQKAIFYLAPVVVLLTGALPIHANAWVFLAWFVPYYLLSVLLFAEVGRGYGQVGYIEQYNFARFAAFAWATLGLFSRHLRFRVTDKTLGARRQLRLLLAPQLLVWGLNLVAIPVGIWRYQHGSHLPPEALGFNLLWAAINLWLGSALLRHLRRTGRHRREEYRFPLPLPLFLQVPGRALPLTIDNIASSGCHLCGPLPPDLRAGSQLRGVLTLPSGPLPVTLQTVTAPMAAGPRRAVGCRFVWQQAELRDQLDQFLYGSDLQWHLLALQERRTTPSEWLLRLGRRLQGQRALPAPPPTDWAVCEVQERPSLMTTPLIGLVALPLDGSPPARLVLQQPLPTGAPLSLLIATRRDMRVVHALAGAVRAIDNAAGPVYVVALQHARPYPAGRAPPHTQDLPCEGFAL